MSLIKFLLLKKKRKKRLLGLFIALVSVARPTCHGQRKTQKLGVDMQRNVVVKLESHSE